MTNNNRKKKRKKPKELLKTKDIKLKKLNTRYNMMKFSSMASKKS